MARLGAEGLQGRGPVVGWLLLLCLGWAAAESRGLSSSPSPLQPLGFLNPASARLGLAPKHTRATSPLTAGPRARLGRLSPVPGLYMIQAGGAERKSKEGWAQGWMKQSVVAAAALASLTILPGASYPAEIFHEGPAPSNPAPAPSSKKLEPAVVEEKTRQFKNILESIDRAYVDDVDLNLVTEKGFNAMLQSLDPYTEYENNKVTQEMRVITNGVFSGGSGNVGLTVDRLPGSGTPYPTVLDSMEGYAFDQGVRVGDRIVSVDGKSTKAMTPQQVHSMFTGQPDSKFEVVLERDGEKKELKLTLERKVVQVEDVSLVAMLNSDKKVGYAKLDGFTRAAPNELASSIVALEHDGPLSTFVLDLRGNTGGLLSSAIEIANLFLPKGSTLLSTKGNSIVSQPADGGNLQAADMDEVYVAKRPPLVSPNTKVVVLVNGETASAAEIVAGAIQDHDRGVVVGERTYGKGLVQMFSRLDEESQIKLTVAKYYTPSGRCIQNKVYRTEEDRNGKASEEVIAQSKKKTFKTDRGRTVSDAGGIEPDLVVAGRKMGNLEQQLLSKNAFLMYAGEWEKEHASAGFKLVKGKEPVVTDAVFGDFQKWVKSNLARGDKGEREPFSGAFDGMERTLKESGYGDAVTELNALRKRMIAIIDSEFETDRTNLKKQLELAIRSRYLPKSEVLAFFLGDDKQLMTATQFSMSETQYTRSLFPEGGIPSPVLGSAEQNFQGYHYQQNKQ